MVMLIMLMLEPIMLLIMSLLQTDTAKIQPWEGRGGGHAGLVGQNGDAGNAHADAD